MTPNLPLALGASSLTLLEHTSAYTTFPDDGIHSSPRPILRVTDYDGRLIDDFPPKVTGVLPAGVARLMVSMLREVINSGTTGTTNDFTGAWFIGFTPSITGGVWVGFDDHRSLGKGEEGSHVALPIWMDFMSQALKGQPVHPFPDSPLLTNPNQVKQILASAGPENVLRQNAGLQQDPSAKISTPSAPVPPVADQSSAKP